MKMVDMLIIFLSLCLTGFSAYAAYLRPQRMANVLIRGQGREWAFPLDAEETVIVSGPLGDTVVRIHDGQAWVESSPCENQTCVITGHIHRQGAWSACLPNSVLVLIEGNDDPEAGVDSVTW
jgi:hypothetical protein